MQIVFAFLFNILLLGFVHTVSSQNVSCGLSNNTVSSLYDETNKEWILTDSSLEIELQEIVNCSNPGDTILFQTSKIVQPSNRVIIPWKLKFAGPEQSSKDKKPSFTCPEHDALFEIRSANSTFKNLVIRDCNLSADDRVGGLIEFFCKKTSKEELYDVELLNVDFVSNTNAHGATGPLVRNPECFTLRMKNVRFESNRYAESMSLSSSNELTFTQLIDNGFLKDGEQKSMFLFPKDSNTTVDVLAANANTGTLLHVKEGTLSVSNATISNTSEIEEGAIVVEASHISVNQSKIEGSKCEGKGAALFLQDPCHVVLNRVQFLYNSASDDGGAIFVRDVVELTIIDCYFQGNEAGGFGGALSAKITNSESMTVSLNMTGSVFVENRAVLGGGAISLKGWSNGEIKMDNSFFIFNDGSYREQSGLGGGLLIRDSQNVSIKIATTVFIENKAHKGGGTSFNETSGYLHFENSHFQANQAITGGGGLAFMNHENREHTVITLETTTIESNIVEKGPGGGLFGYGESLNFVFLSSWTSLNKAATGGGFWLIRCESILIFQCSFVENYADGYGGGLYIYDLDDAAQIIDSTLRMNAALQGGAIYSEDVEITSQTSRFEHNTAEEEGGAISISGNGPFLAMNSSFVFNRAALGGAIYVSGPKRFSAEKCTFKENQVSKYGGGLFVIVADVSSNVDISRCQFSQNTAEIGGGAAFRIDLEEFDKEIPRHVEIYDTQFTDNHAEKVGGAYYIENIEVLATDCLIPAGDSVIEGKGYKSSNFQCASMKNNSAIEYGDNIAGAARSFQVKLDFLNGTVRHFEAGDTFPIPSWKSGIMIPTFNVTTFDALRQGPAISRTHGAYSTITNGLDEAVELVGYVVARIESPDKLIYNQLSTRVENGNGSLTVGVPLKSPGNYILKLWVGEDQRTVTIIKVEIRSCIVNEKTTLNGTLCIICDGNEYNFAPKRDSCTTCPDNCLCDKWGIKPTDNFWLPHPCHTNAMLCLTEIACNFEDRRARLDEFFGNNEPNCDPDFENLTDFRASQCHEGYEGLLCGSCKEGYGQFALDCFKCMPLAYLLFWYFGNLFWTLIVCSAAVIGNLMDSETIRRSTHGRKDTFPKKQSSEDEEEMALEEAYPQNEIREDNAENLNETQTFEDFNEESSRTPLLQDFNEEIMMEGNDPQNNTNEEIVSNVSSPDTPDQKAVNLAQRNMTEAVKSLLNFAQVNSIAMTINTKWDAMIHFVLKALNLIGAVTVETSISLDCLFPKSLPVPRSILREVLLITLPFIVLIILFAYWSSMISMKASLLQRRLVLSAVVVFYVSYIGWAEQFSSAFHCVHIDTGIDHKTWYWTQDTSVECFKGSHATLIVFLVPTIGVILFAFPISSALYLLRKRKRNRLTSEDTREKFGFMYAAYRRECVYWDCVILLRKAGLALIIVFGASLGSNIQGLTCVCILVISLYLQTRMLPWHDDFKILNSVEVFSLLVSVFTFISGLYFNDPSVGDVGSKIVSCLAICLILAFVIFVFYVIYSKTVIFLRLKLLFESVSVSDQDGGVKVIALFVHHKFRSIAKFQA